LYSVAISIYSNGNNLGNFSIYYDNFGNLDSGSFIFLLFTNLFLFLQDAVMFLGLDTISGHLFFTSNFRETTPQLHQFLFIPQAWTIGVEISFYLIAPFLVKRKLKIIFPLIILSLILRLVLHFHFEFKNDPWTYRFFPTELVFFLLGIISYQIYIKLQTIVVNDIFYKLIWIGILVFTLLYSFLPIPGKGYFYIITFFTSLPFIFIYTKNWKIDSYIGELSYPIYISHMFVLSVISVLKIPVIGGKGFILTLTTILFSVILNELVAKKIEKIRQNRIMPN
jgi:hypothetical protein